MSKQRIDTPYGEGLLVTRRARSPVATLLLSHGAGNGIDTPDLVALDRALPPQGITVVRFEQPWRVAGRRLATAPQTLDVALTHAANRMRVRTPLVVGGRSAGARSAARTARSLGAAGCLAIAFPLHPPGRPESTRVDELRNVRVPTLVVQGEKDPMGRPDEFPDLPGVDLTVIPGGDHALRVGKRSPLSPQDALAVLVESTLEWMVREVIGPR